MSLGVGSGHHDNDGGYMPTHHDVLEFVHQCKQCGITQVLCIYINVNSVGLHRYCVYIGNHANASQRTGVYTSV